MEDIEGFLTVCVVSFSTLWFHPFDFNATLHNRLANPQTPHALRRPARQGQCDHHIAATPECTLDHHVHSSTNRDVHRFHGPHIPHTHDQPHAYEHNITRSGHHTTVGIRMFDAHKTTSELIPFPDEPVSPLVMHLTRLLAHSTSGSATVEPSLSTSPRSCSPSFY